MANIMNFFSKSYIREKWGHSGVQRYAKNISWMFFARMFTLGISFLTTLYIARKLGPTNFGELDYALAIIGIFAPLATFGISTVLQRELIRNPKESAELTGTAFFLNLGFALLSTVLVTLYALFSPVDSVSRVLIIILSTTYTLGIFQLFQQNFYARAESKIPSLITMGVWLITSLSKIVVLMLGKGVIWLAATSVLEQAIYAIASLVAYRYYLHGSLRILRLSPRFISLILKTGGATALAGFFTLLYSRIDQIFIRNIIDAHAVGLYSAGVRLVDFWNILPALLLGGLYPALVNARTTSETLYRTRMRRVLLALILSGLALALITSIAAPLLMRYIFGIEFIGGASALRIYAWSMLGTFLGIFIMNILFTDDYRKVLIITNIVPAVVNIVLNLWLIPIYGIVGAAYATVFAYSITPFVPFLFSSTRKRLMEIL